MAVGQSSSWSRDSASHWSLGSIICALALSACSSGGELPERAVDGGPGDDLPAGTLRLPFVVDDYFLPNGCFGDADCSSGVINIDSRACRTRPGTSQGVCRRYRYTPLTADDPLYKGYLGILFQDVGPNGTGEIGMVPGLSVQPGATRVVFWASAGEEGLPVSFRAGGANNWDGVSNANLPYRDSFGVGLDVMLDVEPRQLEIDLTGVSYDTVVSPFGWAIEAEGRTEPIDLFIDDVRWE